MDCLHPQERARRKAVAEPFEKALFVYPDAHLEMRQGARIILKSKVEPPC